MKKRSKSKRAEVSTPAVPLAVPSAERLLDDVRTLIEAVRQYTARTVNAAMVVLYWSIGKRIREDILNQQRTEYGQQVISTLSNKLTEEYGRGYSEPNLSRMMRLAEVFSDENILSALSKELSWSHFVEIIVLDDPLKREFYAELCREERWSTRTLRDQMKRLVYERTAVSKKPEGVIRAELAALRDEDRLTPDLGFRDPYFLDFLGLPQRYQEHELEDAILRELEAFLLELGTDFTFVARQKRITVDSDDFYLDLLFYHRRLRRLVAIDLKLGKFQAADKGQMELYLRWLEKHETHSGEEPPIGLILCAGKSAERVELLRLEDAGIRVAEYLTELPPREMLQRKLHDAIILAREQLVRQADAANAASRIEPPSKMPRKRKKRP